MFKFVETIIFRLQLLGNITINSAPSLEWNLAYTGKYLDLVADLQNNLHRWYDAYIAKWISTDPIGFEAGDANLYRYVGNGPLSRFDPTGEDWMEKVFYCIYDNIGGECFVLEVTGGAKRNRWDCIGSCVDDLMGLWYEISLTHAVANDVACRATNKFTPVPRKRFRVSSKQNTTTAQELWKKMSPQMKKKFPLKYFKLAGKLNTGLLLYEGWLSWKSTAVCTSFCTAAPTDYIFDIDDLVNASN